MAQFQIEINEWLGCESLFIKLFIFRLRWVAVWLQLWARGQQGTCTFSLCLDRCLLTMALGQKSGSPGREPILPRESRNQLKTGSSQEEQQGGWPVEDISQRPKTVPCFSQGHGIGWGQDKKADISGHQKLGRVFSLGPGRSVKERPRVSGKERHGGLGKHATWPWTPDRLSLSSASTSSPRPPLSYSWASLCLRLRPCKWGWQWS